MKKNLFNVFLVCVFCMAAIPDMFAQQIKVTGKVTDSTNEGMPGVNVQVKGTTTGTITDFDGNFRLSNCNRGDTLQFSYVGYVTREFCVTNQTSNLKITLCEDAAEIGSVTCNVPNGGAGAGCGGSSGGGTGTG